MENQTRFLHREIDSPAALNNWNKSSTWTFLEITTRLQNIMQDLAGLKQPYHLEASKVIVKEAVCMSGNKEHADYNLLKCVATTAGPSPLSAAPWPNYKVDSYVSANHRHIQSWCAATVTYHIKCFISWLSRGGRRRRWRYNSHRGCQTSDCSLSHTGNIYKDSSGRLEGQRGKNSAYFVAWIDKIAT